MRGCALQGLLWLILTIGLWADELPLVLRGYEALEVKGSWFGEVSMLAQERDDLIALALNLSPRNRESVVSNHQLSRGIVPDGKAPDYKMPVFARLLFSRGKLLKKGQSEGDFDLGRSFVELAADLDARNDEVIYEFEIQKLDHGRFNWGEMIAGIGSPRSNEQKEASTQE